MEPIKDHCTAFPEYWYNWLGKKVYIGGCCSKHDGEETYQGCHTTDFATCILPKFLIGGTIIFLVASLACLIKYTKETIQKF